MPDLNIVYEPKAEKQLAELDDVIKQQINADIDRDMPIYVKNGTSILKGFGNAYTGAFWAVQSDPYRILVRVEHDKNRVRVMDISRKRFA